MSTTALRRYVVNSYVKRLKNNFKSCVLSDRESEVWKNTSKNQQKK